MMHRKIKPVDVSVAIVKLVGVTWRDTGGTNGWLADPLPEWALELAKSLRLDGVILSVCLRKLPAGQGIPLHVDPKQHQSAKVIERRYHVPLVTHPLVTMRWPDEGEEVHMEAGWLYEVRIDRPHEIVHRGPVDRVHLVVHCGENQCSY